MDNSPNKPGSEAADESKKLMNEETEVKKAKNKKAGEPKVTREHDFTHTHPSHAKHKNFGMDHEPGAF